MATFLRHILQAKQPNSIGKPRGFWIHALTAIPVPLLTPYAINIFPTFKMASIFLIWLAAFWIILATTIGAVVSIDKRYLENAATLEMPRFERLFRVVLPAASPAIFTGCSVALTLSFMMLAVAEMFGSDAGLAWFVNHYSDFARYDLVLMGFIFTAVVLVLVMFVFDKIEARALHWTRRDWDITAFRLSSYVSADTSLRLALSSHCAAWGFLCGKMRRINVNHS